MLSVHTNTIRPEKGHAEKLWGLRESTHPLTTLRRRTWADGKK